MKKAFKNTTKETVTLKWNNEEIAVKPGQTYICDTEYEAHKHAKDVAYTTLNRQLHRKEQKALEEGRNIKVTPITQSQLQRKMQEFLVDVRDTRIIDAKTKKVEDTKGKSDDKKKEPEEKPNFD